MSAAFILHPELQRVYLKKSWDHQKEYIEPAVRAVRKVWRKYFKPESSATSVVDLDTIKDPIRRRRLELTSTITVVEEVENFIKYGYQMLNRKRSIIRARHWTVKVLNPLT